jgi:hypothetical protein
MGNSTVSEVIGIFASIVVLAGLSVVVINGGKAAQVVGAGGGVFVNAINASTHPGTK